MAVNRLGHRCRARTRVALAGVAAIAAVLVSTVLSATVWDAPAASASTISGDQQQIRSIEAQIGRDGAYIEYLSNRYDQAQGRYQAVEAEVSQAAARLSADRSAEQVSRQRLQKAAVEAYMDGSPPSELDAILEQSSVSGLLTRTEFLEVTANNLEDALQAYARAARAAAAQQAVLEHAAAAAAATLVSLRQDEQAAQATVARENALLAHVKGDLQQLLAAAYQQQLAAERAAAQRAAAERAAMLAGSLAQGGVPPASWQQKAAIAVRTALAQVGKPYQWGAAGPNSFDCSGLVMYAWEAAGVYLPHYSGAQYADTTHVSAADLMPGDIVFYDSPYDGSLGHEALYIGNGEVVQAPQSGMDVMVTSITWAGNPVAFGQPG